MILTGQTEREIEVTNIDDEFAGTPYAEEDFSFTFTETVDTEILAYINAKQAVENNGAFEVMGDKDMLINIQLASEKFALMLTKWEYITDADGNELPCNRENKIKLIKDINAQDFIKKLAEVVQARFSAMTKFEEEAEDGLGKQETGSAGSTTPEEG